VALIREAGRERDLDDRQRTARELAPGVFHAHGRQTPAAMRVEVCHQYV
jgi:hypothetical protein